MKNRILIFDLKSGEDTRQLADLLSECQARGVKFSLDKDGSLVYLNIL